MRLGKKERAALKLKEHERRAAQARAMSVTDTGHIRSVWDNPMPRGNGRFNHTGWSKHHKPGKVRVIYG